MVVILKEWQYQLVLVLLLVVDFMANLPCWKRSVYIYVHILTSAMSCLIVAIMIEVGVYNHIPGDGREFVVTDPNAVKIRAEDGSVCLLLIFLYSGTCMMIIFQWY
jgi:predicted S18 family serine protease